jgi:shikimate kinase
VRGVGTASGAVTVVNALATGVGCALAVTLPVRAEIDLRLSGARGASRVQPERGSDSELVRETLAVGLSRFAPGEIFSGELRVDSHVPPGKGLKSSSAVGGAVLRAVTSALRQSRSPEEIARLAADVAQEIGLSATGAYDDCLASLQGGVAFADNTRRTVLRSPSFPPNLRVVLWIPPETHVPSTAWRDRFRAEAEKGRGAVEAVRAGHWAEAMTLNTELVERVMGYDYGALRARLLDQGATMCGVTGMGPTLAVLAPEPRLDQVAACLPSDRGEIRRVDLRGADGVAGESE